MYNKVVPKAQNTISRKLAEKLLLYLLLIILVTGVVWWRNDKQPVQQVQTAQVNPSSTSNPAKTTAPATFNKSQYSLNDPASIWVVVNKGRVLPSDYAPSVVAPNVPLRLAAGNLEMQLRQEMATALQQLFAAANKDGLQLMLASGYRSYAQQVSVYNGFVSSQGQATADKSSARPGHSEHQTGLAADIEPASRTCEIAVCFANTAEGKWLAANSYKYGLIVRYQAGKENLTGYEYEPWHVRFVGASLAAQINKTSQTLEQFFGLPAYADYPAVSYPLKLGT